MILNDDQVCRLRDDIDYIIARTRCNTVQLTRTQVLRAIERDGDVLLDLVEGMPESDARFLSIPLDTLRRLIGVKHRGMPSVSGDSESGLLAVCGE